MKQFIFHVPVKARAMRWHSLTIFETSINAETEKKAWQMLRNRQGDYFDTDGIDAKPDFAQAELIDVQKVTA